MPAAPCAMPRRCAAASTGAASTAAALLTVCLLAASAANAATCAVDPTATPTITEAVGLDEACDLVVGAVPAGGFSIDGGLAFASVTFSGAVNGPVTIGGSKADKPPKPEVSLGAITFSGAVKAAVSIGGVGDVGAVAFDGDVSGATLSLWRVTADSVSLAGAVTGSSIALAECYVAGDVTIPDVDGTAAGSAPGSAPGPGPGPGPRPGTGSGPGPSRGRRADGGRRAVSGKTLRLDSNEISGSLSVGNLKTLAAVMITSNAIGVNGAVAAPGAVAKVGTLTDVTVTNIVENELFAGTFDAAGAVGATVDNADGELVGLLIGRVADSAKNVKIQSNYVELGGTAADVVGILVWAIDAPTARRRATGFGDATAMLVGPTTVPESLIIAANTVYVSATGGARAVRLGLPMSDMGGEDPGSASLDFVYVGNCHAVVAAAGAAVAIDVHSSFVATISDFAADGNSLSALTGGSAATSTATALFVAATLASGARVDVMRGTFAAASMATAGVAKTAAIRLPVACTDASVLLLVNKFDVVTVTNVGVDAPVDGAGVAVALSDSWSQCTVLIGESRLVTDASAPRLLSGVPPAGGSAAAGSSLHLRCNRKERPPFESQAAPMVDLREPEDFGIDAEQWAAANHLDCGTCDRSLQCDATATDTDQEPECVSNKGDCFCLCKHGPASAGPRAVQCASAVDYLREEVSGGKGCFSEAGQELSVAFSPGFSGTRRRFLIPAGAEFPDLYEAYVAWRVTGGRKVKHARVEVQLGRTTYNFDHVTVGGQYCDRLGLRDDECGWLRTCVPINSGSPIITDDVLAIRAGPAHRSACGNAYLEGVVSVTRASLRSTPEYSVLSLTGDDYEDNEALEGLKPRGKTFGASDVTVYAADSTVTTYSLVRFLPGPGDAQAPGLGADNRTAKTAKVVACDVFDASSFEVMTGFIGTGDEMECLTADGNGGLRKCKSVSEYQMECMRASDCAGYSTVLRYIGGDADDRDIGRAARPELSQEVPVALHYYSDATIKVNGAVLHRFDSDAGVALAAAFYRRPSVDARTCKFVVGADGANVTLAVAQTSFSEEYVEVYVKQGNRRGAQRMRVARCGDAYPFSARESGGRLYGMDGECDQYYSCVTVASAGKGTEIEVVAGTGVRQNGCHFSLSVLAMTSVMEVAAPKPLFQGVKLGALFSMRHVAVPAAVLAQHETLQLTLMTAGVTEVMLRVAQTRFACRRSEIGGGGVGELGSERRRMLDGADAEDVAEGEEEFLEFVEDELAYVTACPDGPAVKLNYGDQNMTCGGNKPFAVGYGITDQCGAVFDCARTKLKLSMALNDTGSAAVASSAVKPITLDLNTEFMTDQTVAATGSCGGFYAELWVRQDETIQAATGIGAFPLQYGDNETLVALLRPMDELEALPAGTSITDDAASALFPVVSDVPAAFKAVNIGTITGPLGRPFAVVHVPWKQMVRAAGIASLRAALSPTLTVGCVIDNLARSQYCEVPVPTGATHARVDVMQSDFRANSVKISLVSAKGHAEPNLGATCGYAHKFGGLSGQTGQCSTYLPCFNGFLHPVGSEASLSYLRVSVAGSLSSGGCTNALQALITFSDREEAATECDASTHLFCDADRTCIPRNSVCDGVVRDCSSGADETRCTAFREVEQSVTLDAEVIGRTVAAATSMLDCRREAVLSGAPIFAVNGSGCQLVNSSAAGFVTAYPEYYAPYAASGRSLYISKNQVADQSAYRRCSALLSCSGNGRISDNRTCACECSTAYIGTQCQTPVRSGVPAEYMALVKREYMNEIRPKQLKEALRARHVLVNIRGLGTPFAFSDKLIAFPFRPTAPTNPTALTTYKAAVFTDATRKTMNEVLSQLGAREDSIVHVFTIDRASTFQSLGPCHEDRRSRTFTCSPAHFLHGVLRFTGRGLSSLKVTTHYDSATGGGAVAPAARRAGGGGASGATTTVECTGVLALVPETSSTSCKPMSCVVRTSGIDTSFEVSYVKQEDCTGQPSLSVEAAMNTGVAADDMPVGGTTISVSYNSSVFYIGIIGIAVALFGALLAVIAAVFMFGALRRAAASLGGRYVRRRAVKRELAAFAREKLIWFNWCGRDAVAIGFGTFVVLALLLVGFVFVVYIKSKTLAADTSVVVEFFQSAQCNGSVTNDTQGGIATLPERITMIPATMECLKLSVTGNSDGQLFGHAECRPDGTAVLSVERTMARCRAARTAPVSQSSCVKAVTFMVQSTGFARVRCIGNDAAEAAVKNVASRTPFVPQDVSVSVANVTNVLMPRLSGGTFYAPTIVAGVPVNSTSNANNTWGSIASESYFFGDYDERRLLAMEDDAFGPQRAKTNTTALELSHQHVPALDIEALKAFSPSGDYPLGFIFGGLSTADEVTEDDNGPTAQRYFGIYRTGLDLGHFYGHTKAEQETDGRSATISLWLKATSVSKGTVFAVADHYEDGNEERSKVIERLHIVANEGASGATPWFDSSWHLYSSLVIDGPAGKLQFVFADPVRSGFGANTIVRAEWDLTQIDQSHLLNGRWHRVSLAFKNEEGRFFVVLVVDGRSTVAGSTWRKCLGRHPTPIRNNATRAFADSSLAASQVIATNGGVLYLGYVNAGVQGLTVASSFETQALQVRTGTRPQRIHSSGQIIGIEIVAVILVTASICTALCCLYILAGLWENSKRLQRGFIRSVQERYADVTEPHDAVLFPVGFKALGYMTARSWLKVPAGAFAQVIEEMVSQPTLVDGRSKLLLALWCAKRESMMGYNPAVHDDPLWQSGDYPTKVGWAALLRDCVEVGDVQPAAAGGAGDADDNGADFAEAEAGDAKGALEAAGGAVTNGFAGKDFGGQLQKMIPVKIQLPGNIGTQLQQIVLTVMSTGQAAFVYVSNMIGIPEFYQNTVQPVVHFFSMSFRVVEQWFNHPLALPLLMLAGAFATLVLLSILFANDERRFYGNLARYQLRRDLVDGRLDAVRPELREIMKLVDRDLDVEGGRSTHAYFQQHHHVHVVDPEERCALQRYVDAGTKQASKVPADRFGSGGAEQRGEPVEGNAGEPPVFELKARGGTAPVRRVPGRGCCCGTGPMELVNELEPLDAQQPDRRAEQVQVPPELDEAGREKLKVVSHRCVRHGGILQPIEYIDVFPYHHRRECCIVENGERCGTSEDKMYCCPQTDPNGRLMCGYAVCHRHMRSNLRQLLYFFVRSQYARFFGQGIGWLLEMIAINAALMVYTPVMRTCVMILGCHPVYQCEFGDCWSDLSQQFVASAYLSVVTSLLFGVGFPMIFLYLLSGRIAALSDIFTRVRYKGQYMEQCSVGDTPGKNAALHASARAVALAHLITRRHASVGAARSAYMRQYLENLNASDSDDDGHSGAAAGMPGGEKISEVSRPAPPDCGAAAPGVFTPPPEAETAPDAPESSTASGAPTTEAVPAAPDAPAAGLPTLPSGFHDAPGGSLFDSPTAAQVPGGTAFSNPPDSGNDAAAAQAGSAGALAGIQARGSADSKEPLLASPGGAGSPRNRAAKERTALLGAVFGMDSQRIAPLAEASRHARRKKQAVLNAEWERFLKTDSSVLAELYRDSPFERLPAVPLLIIGRFLLLVPPLLLEPSSLLQFGFIAGGEIVFAIVFMLFAPFVSPWMTIVTLVSSVHQFLTVAVQAHVTARANYSDVSGAYGYVMVGVSTTYAIIVVAIVLGTTLSGYVEERLKIRSAQSFYDRFGLTRPETAPLYIAPRNDRGEQGIDSHAVDEGPYAVEPALGVVAAEDADAAADAELLR